jgi:prepilin-type N-terminal cleavage/methylation domain-containing protein
MEREKGFTLVELMIVVVIIGILAAISIPNFMSMTSRAKEGSLKSNMHSVQLAAEDYIVLNTTGYATDATDVLALIPTYGGGVRNPFDNSSGSGNAWVDQPAWTRPLATGVTKAGVLAYGDSLGLQYQIRGRGQRGDLPLVLGSGSQ